MEHTALYRKWRPLTFAEMVGQTQVTLTLCNQIKSKQLSHAYMFSGIRGTGKTSVARLFARAVNCLEPLSTGDPCNACSACLSILSDQCMDVIEMDAASNNGVDDIRDIREHVKFPPSQVKYKVYIIDEIHMLSKGAFNALLKTLEEPPQHVLFLLATTELHKVPATILSRCQRYEFRKIPQDLMAKRLAFICSEEKYPATEKAIQLIVNYSEGALRDAQSLLNQCMSFAPEGLDYDLAIEALGKAKDHAFETVFASVAEQNVSMLLSTVQALTEEGKDLTLFLEDCIDRLRQAMLSHLVGSTETLEGALAQIPLVQLLTMIEDLAKLGQDMKWSSAPRVLFEVCWIRLIKPELAITLEGLDQRISAIEKGKIQEVIKPIGAEEKPVFQASEKAKVDEHLEAIPLLLENAQNLTFAVIQEHWGKLLEAVRQELKTTHALLKETALIALSGNEVQVAFPSDLAVLSGGLEKEENRKLIDSKLLQIYGSPLRLKVISPIEIQEKRPKEDQLTDYFSGFEDKVKMK